MTRVRGLSAALPIVLLVAAGGLAGCAEEQATDRTSYGRVSQLDPPCITPEGGTQLCFSAMQGQLDDVKTGDCVELRSRPGQAGGVPPIMTIRPIPPSGANGACGAGAQG
ncbi:hypothetical protein K8Z61_02890 [Nocardioides sp. TRM66260-LWL]|uniref:hypothetical protein n=1 Tax=Nocardioides sp. TRM66260-LWL TaxID=2874478 RepID=UPI001CC4F353|nr:hypothetical protein [Nocardioides sp. TRM66260-LWL]MBZ5733432.1 hypothetical protein [Nocardioides sp. TRM66260-LWL]